MAELLPAGLRVSSFGLSGSQLPHLYNYRFSKDP
jgi:hypothetical protein